MNNPRLWKLWGIVEANLKDAQRYFIESCSPLEEASQASLCRFDEYLSHNELGLAMEELAALGSEYPCKAAFWRRLEDAANGMELPNAAVEFHEKFLAAVRA
jgi:hypothetical protein